MTRGLGATGPVSSPLKEGLKSKSSSGCHGRKPPLLVLWHVRADGYYAIIATPLEVGDLKEKSSFHVYSRLERYLQEGAVSGPLKSLMLFR